MLSAALPVSLWRSDFSQPLYRIFFIGQSDGLHQGSPESWKFEQLTEHRLA